MAAILAGQGFGTRKECARMVSAGLVEVGKGNGGALHWKKSEDPDEPFIPDDLHFRIEGLTLPCQKNMHIVLHKPADTECSHTPTHHQSVFDLLPKPFLNRGMEAVGRLDADTTGLLLLSDSGPFNHFFTSPKRHVPKTYRVGTKHPITDDQKTKLEAGVELHNEEGISLPARVAILSGKICELTLEEGKYHQVKRMFGAVGNRVESIHRMAIGNFKLEETLTSGRWRILDETDLLALGFRKTGP